jgi:hypothetical protein
MSIFHSSVGERRLHPGLMSTRVGDVRAKVTLIALDIAYRVVGRAVRQEGGRSSR